MNIIEQATHTIKAIELTVDAGYTAKRAGINQLTLANTAGESLLNLRQTFWDEYHKGKQLGWKEFCNNKDINLYNGIQLPIDYLSVQRYIHVHLNWDIIIERGWDKTLTYSQVVHKVLPAIKQGKKIDEYGEPVNDEGLMQDTNIKAAETRTKHIIKLKDDEINKLKQENNKLKLQVLQLQKST